MEQPRTNKSTQDKNPNGWGFLRDTLIYAMSKGQLLLFFPCLWILVILIKIDPDQSSQVINRLITIFEDASRVGWFVSFLLIICWYTSNRYLRSIHGKEINRITTEKSRHQKKRTEGLASSSKKNN